MSYSRDVAFQNTQVKITFDVGHFGYIIYIIQLITMNSISRIVL